MKKLLWLIPAAVLLTGCGHEEAGTGTVIGDFDEDYGSAYSTSAEKEDNVPEYSQGDGYAVSAADEYYLEGMVYDTTDNSVRLYDKNMGRISAVFKDAAGISDIQPGDMVRIAYDGYILEIYPAIAENALSVEVLEKADRTYEYVEQSSEAGSFSLLIPEGWSWSEIDYPPEGDLTDLGINIYPADGEEQDGFDIGWHSSFAIYDTGMEEHEVTVNGMTAAEYSENGCWKFIVFDSNYAVVNHFSPESTEKYSADIEFMLSTFEII